MFADLDVIDQRLDPEKLGWFYVFVKLKDGSDLFCGAAKESDTSMLLRYPIKATSRIDKQMNLRLVAVPFNPYSLDEYTRIRMDDVSYVNSLSDKYRKVYKQAVLEYYGESDEELEKDKFEQETLSELAAAQAEEGVEPDHPYLHFPNGTPSGKLH